MTIATTIEVFQQATELGLKLGIEPPDTLKLEPAKRCSVEFANTLRRYKPQLLTLLKLPFCMVFSEALQETIFFCEDEDTKAALVEAGASEWSIYTRYELQMLFAQNRIAPLTAAELRKVHEIKRTFNASITESLTNSRAAHQPVTGGGARSLVNVGTKGDVFVVTEEQRHELIDYNRELNLERAALRALPAGEEPAAPPCTDCAQTTPATYNEPGSPREIIDAKNSLG